MINSQSCARQLAGEAGGRTDEADVDDLDDADDQADDRESLAVHRLRTTQGQWLDRSRSRSRSRSTGKCVRVCAGATHALVAGDGKKDTVDHAPARVIQGVAVRRLGIAGHAHDVDQRRDLREP